MEKLKVNIKDLKTDELSYFYYNGELFTGIAEEYIGNHLIATWEYKNGIPDGNYFSYYENGGLKMQSTYCEGRINGVKKKWYDNGSLEEETEVVKGVQIHRKKWDKNGNLTEEKKFQNPFENK